MALDRDLMMSLAVPNRRLGLGESPGFLSFFIFEGILSAAAGSDFRRGPKTSKSNETVENKVENPPNGMHCQNPSLASALKTYTLLSF